MIWIHERPLPATRTAPTGASLSPSSAPSSPAVEAPARLRAWVNRLAIPRHRTANPAGNRRVREEILTEFEARGFTAEVVGRYQNVIARPKSARRQRLTWICAHYDAVPDVPGADDNASGLAVMLECARRLGDADRGEAVGFVAFNAEEEGLLGSADFVHHVLPGLRSTFRTAHVLEMVGFRRPSSSPRQRLPLPWVPRRFLTPDFLGLVANNRSNADVGRALRSNAAPDLRVLAAKTWGPMHWLMPDLQRSDHLPFWRADVPAVLWTDTANFRNPNYHRVTDTPETLDPDFMAGVAEILTAVASREVAP